MPLGRHGGDEIALPGSFAPGTAIRWIHSRITPDSVHCLSLESTDGRAPHRPLQEMCAPRQ